VGDDSNLVKANRARLQEAIGVRAVFLDQVHGTHSAELHAASSDGLEADAVWTHSGGLACTVMVADCLPVLFCNTDGLCVAAAHAGWRGLLGKNGRGVLEQTIETMDFAGQAPGARSDWMAWLGPCIGPRAFEVGDEVRAAFVGQSTGAASCFVATAHGKWLAHLPELAKQRLAVMGIERTFGNDGSDAWCTVSNPSRFFSHRRDRVSGRMAACVWLQGHVA
jgi:YfiH family protein